MVSDVLDVLETIAPKRFAFSWDKVGLQVGNRDTPVEKAVVALDRSMGAIHYAIESDAQLLLTHHPLIFDPISTVTSDTYEGQAIQKLVFYGISHICAHTNWDAAPGGINDVLATILGLQDVRTFGSSAGGQDFKIVVFAPLEASERIIDAFARVGAGYIGKYTRCAFQGTGTGTFEALENSSPSIGQAGERSTVEETRIEMVCPSHLVTAVTRAVREAHPYEEPAIDVYPLKPNKGQQGGRVGQLSNEASLLEFSRLVDSELRTRSLCWGDPNKVIRTVAVAGGAADGEWRSAQAAGADILITGEVKQHVALEASESGFAIMAAGHYATEHPGTAALGKQMAELIPSVEWLVFEPQPGTSGRPL